MTVAEFVRSAHAEFGVASRSRNVRAEIARGIGGGGNNVGVDHGIHVFFSAIERNKEAALGGEEDWARGMALVNAALFAGFSRRQRILRVKGRVAKEEIELAV